METIVTSTIALNSLLYLPAYAQYLLAQRLNEYCEKQLEYSYELNIPLLKYFEGLSEEEKYVITRQGATEFLTYLADNNAVAQISESLERWKTNQLPLIDRDAIVAEDITLVNYMRKKCLLHFVADYACEPLKLIELIKEIDFFLIESLTTSTNLFIDLLKERIEEHSFFIQKVNETTPGAIYVFDVQEFKLVYTNHKLHSLIGREQNELNDLGQSVIIELIHPDDQKPLRQHLQTLRKAKDNEIANCKFRIRTKSGDYKWLVNYESVFKRHDNGAVWQTIGITLDIDNEQKALAELSLTDKRHKEAEALSHIGTYAWDIGKDDLQWSDEMYRIYEISPDRKLTNDLIASMIHPDDRSTVHTVVREALATQKPYDFYYRIITQNGNEKILHSRGRVQPEENGEGSKIVGTDQDVTEKQRLIHSLRKSEELYKKAEAIANMGNWVWDMNNNQLEWTDQLYEIYGLEPQAEAMTIQRFLSFVHPNDREYVESGVEKLRSENVLDYTFRIITANGVEKWLRSIAQVVRDHAGNIASVVGIEQDVTEKQKLISKLEESQRLYKQAQELARMGNFSWDLETNEVFWSDEVYKIYERPFGSNIKFDDAFLPIVDEYKQKVQTAIREVIANKEGQSISYAIRRKEGGLRYINLHTDVTLNLDGSVCGIVGTVQDVTEKEELIERLQQSEKLYKQAQTLAHLGNWTYDFSNDIISWSDELFTIYELPQGKPLTRDRWISYLSPEDQERMNAQFLESIKEQKPLDIIHAINFPDGRKKILHRRGEVVYDNDGNATKMIGTTQDITEQYKIQSELKESQTFIRKITDATPSIIATYNINTGKYSFISEGLEKLLGYPTSLVMEKGTAFFAEIIHPDDLTPIMEKNAMALAKANESEQQSEMVVEFTYRVKHKNGTYRWLHTYGTIFDRNAKGKVEHVLNISLDVTSQMEAAEKIKEQEHFIQQIADASPMILYLFDVSAQSMAYINREAFFVLGYLPDEILEQQANITDFLYHPDDIQLLPCRKQSGKKFQQVDSMIQYECRMRHKDGDYRWMLVREIVFKTEEDGDITQIIGAALDINRRKEMERTILQNTLQLEQSNASLEEFAYVASHDLKEPLRKISTFGDRLVASQIDKLSNDGKIYLNKIIDASQRMQNMISDLLSISMISGNREFETHSLQKILEETLQTLEYKIEQQQAVVRYSVLPEANIIPSQFRQLFQNLLSNSLKFVREGVQPLVVIQCSEITFGEVQQYQVAAASKYIKLTFSDNGIGFENEYAQKIFAIFQRLHGRSEYEGSGIGLAICKKIVEHHGGVIFAQGEPGAGATFTIILPT